MPGFVVLRVEGLDQRLVAIDEIVNGMQQAKLDTVQELGDYMANEMRANAHVITGRMKGSINNVVAGEQATVSVPVEYAAYENRRPGAKAGYGPHNFADMAVQATQQIAQETIKRHYDDMFRNV